MLHPDSELYEWHVGRLNYIEGLVDEITNTTDTSNDSLLGSLPTDGDS